VPKTHRDLLKKQLGHAINNIELAQLRCLELKDGFQGPHPDLAELLQATMVGLEVCLDSLRAFSMHAWGIVPPNVERWRETELEDDDERESEV